jgi:hypothetical protein
MTDNQVIAALISAIEAGFTLFNVENVEVLGNYQPTQQGGPDGDAIFIHKLPSKHYGHPIEKNVPNESGGFDQTRTFIRLSNWQINAQATVDPADVNARTASDLVQTAADILNMPEARASLDAAGIGLERVTNIRVTYVKNEKDRFEGEPSFDITLNHSKTYSTAERSIVRAEPDIHRT